MFAYTKLARALNPGFGPLDQLIDSWTQTREADANWQLFSPSADVYETTDGYLIEVDLPGLTEKEVTVQVEGRELTIRGERKLAQEGDTLRQERGRGRFERLFRLPDDVDVGRVVAKAKNGVLSITLPRAESAKAKTIQVVAE